MGLPVAGVRGTTGDLPGVVPGRVDGTGTSLCKHQPCMPSSAGRQLAVLDHCNITQKQPVLMLLASQSASHQMHLQNAETEACC